MPPPESQPIQKLCDLVVSFAFDSGSSGPGPPGYAGSPSARCLEVNAFKDPVRELRTDVAFELLPVDFNAQARSFRYMQKPLFAIKDGLLEDVLSERVFREHMFVDMKV